MPAPVVDANVGPRPAGATARVSRMGEILEEELGCNPKRLAFLGKEAAYAVERTYRD